jgi:uracil-DNA glycosylase
MYEELFGKEWFNLLKNYLESKEFKNIGLDLNKEYKTKIIIPNKGSEFFRIFKDLQPSNIKVIILGLDPYPQPGVYTGYAFDNANSEKLSPSLRNIFKEIKKTYPDSNEDWDLSKWVNQGVFLVNTALSVEAYSPNSHTSLWKPFTIEWIKRLSKYRNDLIWLLWGSKAQEFNKYIDNSSHMIIKTPHPSPLNVAGGFIGSNCFIKCNEQLKGLNKKEILW